MNQKNNSQKEMKKDNSRNKNKNISKYYKHKYI